MNLPNWLISWVWQALMGEIYPEIRAIALRFDSDKNLLVRFYLDREPIENDLESADCVISNILAHTSSEGDIVTIENETIFSTERMAELDALDGFVYARKEFVDGN